MFCPSEATIRGHRREFLLSELLLGIVIRNVTVVRSIAVTTVVLLVVHRRVRRHAILSRSRRCVVEDRHANAAVLSLLLTRRLRRAYVLRLVEVREETEEQDTVETYPDHETARVVALGEQQLELVGHYHDELDLKLKFTLLVFSYLLQR